MKKINSLIHSLPLIPLMTQILFVSELRAANHILAFGASGEPTCIEGSTNPKNQKPKCESTIFDSNIRQLGQSLKEMPHWSQDISYNGGHKKTEELLKGQFKKSSPFDAIEYERLISESAEKIKNGSIKKGESLVVIIDTHGAEKNKDSKTHLIAAGQGELKDLNSLSGSTLVSLDSLEKLIELSRSKGINLGIVDLSCHSGATMALKKNAPHACIVTSTSADHYGYGGEETFGNYFIKNMKPGMTMEKAFLAARTKSVDPDYPMISTDEGMSIYQEMQSLLSPFLKYENSNEGKLALSLKAFAQNPSCHYVDQFESLIKLIESLRKVSDLVLQNKLILFKSRIQKYFNLQKSLYESASQLGLDQLKKVETFNAPINLLGKKIDVFSRNLTIEEILDGNHDDAIKAMDNNIAAELRKKPIDQIYLGKLAASKNIFQQLQVRKNQLISQYPQMKNSLEYLKKISRDIGNSKELSTEIAKLEKSIFDELYKKRQTLNFEDPCRKITF